MSKKPYIIQQGSNNLVIVPTQNFKPPLLKVNSDTENLGEKLVVKEKRESVFGDASHKVYPGASRRNSNVLIDVSKVKTKPLSWASNFLQSIGGTSPKPPRTYHNLAKKSTLLRKENIQTNICSQATSLKAHQPEKHKQLYEPDASKATNTNTATIREGNVVATDLEGNKKACSVDVLGVQIHPKNINKEVTKLTNKKVDSKPKPLQEVLQVCKETDQKTAPKRRYTELKEKTKLKDVPSQLKANKSKELKSNKVESHKITSQAKADKEASKHNISKGITKTKIKNEISSVKSLSKKSPNTGDIVLNLKKNKITEKKRGKIKINNKETCIRHKESFHKGSIKSKSPIKSVVKKISSHRLRDSHSHYLKNTDCNQLNAYTDLDADLRSKLKRKYPPSNTHKYEESKDNRTINNKLFSPVPQRKGFVPDENLIISFNAESEDKETLKKMSPMKTKKQKIGSNKCKKIKLQINIILKNSNTSDDDSTESEIEEDDDRMNENMDLSFLDDFNIDEIVDSLNDSKSYKAKTTSTGLNDKCTPKECVETMDTMSIEKEDSKHVLLQSQIENQRIASPKAVVKIDGNNVGSINEVINDYTVVKEEQIHDAGAVSINAADLSQRGIAETNTSSINLYLKKEIDYPSDPIDKCDETIPPQKSSTNICDNGDVMVDITTKEPKSLMSPLLKKQLEHFNNNSFETVEESKSMERKPAVLQQNNKTKEDIEEVILINETTDAQDKTATLQVREQLVDYETVDLTLTKDDNSLTESDDVVIVDVNKACVIEVDTEPILILDTDKDTGIDLKSSSESDENKNASNAIPTSLDKSSGQNVVDTNKTNLNLQCEIQSAKDKIVNNAKTTDITLDKKSNKLETKYGNPKSENDNVPNQTRPKTQLRTQNQVPSNNTKNNEIIPNSADDSLTKDILARRLEDTIEEYLGEKHNITQLIHRGKYSVLYAYEDKNRFKNTIKVIKNKCDRNHLGDLKENMLMELQNGVPEENLNLVRLINNGFSMSGQWCFLMEYYPKNLQEVLDQQTPGYHIDAVQRLSAQLVAAVTILRNNNIIHSDIKPSHILLNHDDTKLKLCGFDQAFYYNGGALLPNVGTPSYRAPELILGYPADYGIDVWSTALVMYEMATRRKLFPGMFNNDILYKQLCTLDGVTFDMLVQSRFRRKHFKGNSFSRVTGIANGVPRIQFIQNFHKKERIHNVLFQVYYESQWAKQRTGAKRIADKTKLSAFAKLLKQMLVMHPMHRIAIEFVFANPFMYETFDG